MTTGETLQRFYDDQQIVPQDHNDLGDQLRLSIDHVVNDGIAAGFKFYGFSVGSPSAMTVTVGAGRLWKNGEGYGNYDEGGIEFDLTSRLPLNSLHKRIISILGYPNPQSDGIEPRTYLVDAVTEDVEARPTATIHNRRAELTLLNGTEGVDPQPPSVPSDRLEIARVKISQEGYLSFEYVEDNRIVSAENLNNRVKVLEAWRITAETKIETIASDVGAIANQNTNTANPLEAILREVISDLAVLKLLAQYDSGSALISAVQFMDADEVDDAAAGHDCRVEEGIHFPIAAQLVSPQTLALANPAEPRVRTLNGWVMPNGTDVARLSVWTASTFVSINTYAHQSVTFWRFYLPRWHRRYGVTFIGYSQANQWYSPQYRDLYLPYAFARPGETFTIVDRWPLLTMARRLFRGLGFWLDAMTYYSAIGLPSSTGRSGSMIAQSWLNSQAGILTGIKLRFRTVDLSQSVSVFVCELKDGRPNIDEVITEGIIEDGDAIAGLGGQIVTLRPAYLKAGARYAVIVITAGNYQLYAQSNVQIQQAQQFAGGSLFYSTDGNAWAVDVDKDINFELRFAQAQNPTVTFQLGSITLTGGMSVLDFLTDEVVPDGCEAYFEIRKQGDANWITISNLDGAHPLATKPTTVELRMTLVGTNDLFPMINIGNSKVNAYRTKADFTATTPAYDAGTNVDTIELRVLIPGWVVGGQHTLTTTILSGGGFATVDTPDSTVDKMLPGGVLERRMIFTPTATTQFKVKYVGHTNTAEQPYVITGHDYAAYP